MNTLKQASVKFLRRLITFCKADEVLSGFLGPDSKWRKAMPNPSYYSKEEYDFQLEKGLNLIIDRSDYTQWRIFSGSLSVNPRIVSLLDRKGDIVALDIGANIGAYSVLLARSLTEHQMDIHLFEPNPFVFSRLQANVDRLQKWRSKVRCVSNQLGVGDREYNLKLRFSKAHTGKATFVDQGTFDEELEVPVVQLDSYVARQGLQQIDFIKLDVESFEPSAFLGAKEAITKYRPLIYFEFSNKWFLNYSEETITDIIDRFNGAGYRMALEKGTGFREFDFSLDNLKTLKYGNFLAIPG